MKFNEVLNHYMDLIGCTAKELSDVSGISTSVISRYRKGDRVPKCNSMQQEQLINGLLLLMEKHNIKNIDTKLLQKEFDNCLNKNNINFDIFKTNFNLLIDTLSINVSDLSKYMGFDSSYLSKIKSGKRIPQHLDDFVDTIVKYITFKYHNIEDKERIALLLNCDISDIQSKEDYSMVLNKWISSSSVPDGNSVQDFLTKLDEFELNEYIKSIHFDKIKVPTMPIQLPKSKIYYGLNGFKNSQLDVLKMIVLSKSCDDVFFYSNMSFLEGSKDTEFAKKFMIGLALVLKKGIHLHMIHDLDRPWKELMLGLEGWIPLYMTGQIHPYFFNDNSNLIFSRILCVSGTSSLSGSSVTGNIEKARFYVTNKKEEVLCDKDNAKFLLKKAHHLMDIYNIEKKDSFEQLLSKNIKMAGNRRNIYYNLPIYTISFDLLNKILNRNDISYSDKKMIINYVKKEKKMFEDIMKDNNICDEITILNKDEYINNECSLSLSHLFYDKRITYTWDEYLEHIDIIKNIKNAHYKLKIGKHSTFKNINISIIGNKQVIISKENSPSIHFSIIYPRLVEAIQKFKVPIKE